MINLFIHGTRFNKFKENSCRMNIPFYTVFSSLASPTSEKEILNHLGLLYHHHWCMGALVYTNNALLELFHSYCALLILFDSIFHIKLKDILIQQNQMRSIQSEGKKKKHKDMTVFGIASISPQRTHVSLDCYFLLLLFYFIF